MGRGNIRDTLVVFRTALGWFAVQGRGPAVRHLTFGHRSAEAARRALEGHGLEGTWVGRWNGPLVERLQAYAAGQPDDFLDVEIDLEPATAFQRRVLSRCRRIPHGQTRTYGALAAECGSPGGARAVGNCMATNPIPLIIPCHRVVAADGSLGGYSAPGGVRLKRRLLDLEAGHGVHLPADESP